MRHHGLWISYSVLAMSLLSSVVTGQARPATAPPAASAGMGDAANVGPDATVITVDGFCGTDPSVQPKAPCRTVITRSEFEKLADVSGATTAAARAQFAVFYVKYSLFAREAQKQGMDKDPRFQRKLELARIQSLGQLLLQDMQVKSGQFAPGEMEKFFRENPALFEQATLLRVYIPKTKFKDLPNGIQQPVPESAPEMKLVAEAIYSRARTGADFEALQKEALDTANLKDEMSGKLGTMSRDHLRRSQQVVFDLKPGEISALFDEREEGYYIYKIVSKEMPSFESVKSDVGTALQKHRMDTWLNNVTDPVQVNTNDEYFGASPWPKASKDH